MDGEDVRAVQHSRITDDGVHRAHPIDLFRDVARLLQVGQVPNNGGGAAVQEVMDRGKTGSAAYTYGWPCQDPLCNQMCLRWPAIRASRKTRFWGTADGGGADFRGPAAEGGPKACRM